MRTIPKNSRFPLLLLAVLLLAALFSGCMENAAGGGGASISPAASASPGITESAAPDPEVSAAPEASEAPVSSDAPEASETPAQTGAPQSSTAPADSGAAESSDAPQNSGAPEVISRGPSTSRKIAYITIDDGPSRAVTPAILDVLRDEGVKATFFVLPHANVSDLYRRILEEGHAIGNHTFSHDYKLLYVPDDVDAFRDDVLKMRDYIQSLYGYDMKVFRFPGGTMGRPEPVLAPRRTVLLEFGYKTFDWDISVGDAAADASAKNPDALVSNVLNNLGSRERPILLMHDSAGKSATPEALKRIIETLRDKGYVFDTLENY